MRFADHIKIKPCESPIWANSAHLQTMLGYLIPSQQLTNFGEKIEVTVNGGDRLVSRHLKGPSDLVVYLFHGLGGCTLSSYMQRTAILARNMGHTVILTNHRGSGEGEGMAKEPYHSGRAEDLSSVIQYGRKLYPQHKHLAIGFSLSGNALLLLAAGQRANEKPDAAIAVNAPIDLKKCSEMLGRSWNRIYDYKFMQDMRGAIKTRRMAGYVIPEVPLRWNTLLAEFDDLYTAPYGGFKDRLDYYGQCSAKQYLHMIDIPTVLLTAEDDPFVAVEDYREAKISPHVIRHIEHTGGHMGYLTRDKNLRGFRWLDYALGTYINSLEK